MRKAVVPAVLFLLLPLSLLAQTPKAEVFGGYSYMRLQGSNLNGWNVSLAGNVNKNLGIVAEFSGHYNRENFTDLLGNTQTKLSVHSFLVGPRLSDRSTKWFTPFVHVLLGYSRLNAELTRTGNPATAISSSGGLNGFGLTAGGGLDVAGDKALSYRILQADYSLLREHGDKHEGFRLSTGVVWRLGHKQD